MEAFLSLLVDGIKHRPYVPFLIVAGGLFTVSRCRNPLFKPLPSPDCTRLLELSAGSGALEADVRKINLEQEQHIMYFALSYMWGSRERPEGIRFGDHTIRIGANLHSALTRMRQNFPPSITGMRIWADALCINQRNDETSRHEKEQQLSIMSKIFSKAECVVVDLGTMPENFDAFKSMMDAVMECMASGVLRLDRTGMFQDHVQAVFPYLQNHPALGDAMTVAFELLFRPYWQRIWMVQETTVAKRRRYLIGNIMVEATIFDITLRCMTKIFEKGHYVKTSSFSLSWLEFVSQTSILSLGPNSKIGARLIGQTRLTYNDNTHHKLSMYDLLSRLMQQQKNDPRDRIYGLLSMADLQAMPFNVGIDMSIPCRTLSLAVSRQFIHQGQLDALLALSCTVVGSNALPSWSLDLEDPRTIYSHFDTVCIWRSDFSANHGQEQNLAKLVSSTTLQISCCMIDTVDELCDGYPSRPHILTTSNGTKYLKDLSFWFQCSQDWAKGVLSDTEGDDVLESYYNCLVAGMSHDGEQSAFWPSDAFKGTRTRADRDSLMLICDWQIVLEYFCRVMEDSSDEELDNDQDITSTDIPLSDAVGVIQEIARDQDEMGQLLNELWTSSCLTTPVLKPIEFGRLGVTHEQRLGLFPLSVEAGDHVCILAGVSVPFVLRRFGEAYKVVGHCYVYGLMDGEMSKSHREFVNIELI